MQTVIKLISTTPPKESDIYTVGRLRLRRRKKRRWKEGRLDCTALATPVAGLVDDTIEDSDPEAEHT